MNSYLIKYEYSYAEKPSNFSIVVEGDTYKEAAENFMEDYHSATMLSIEVLPPDYECPQKKKKEKQQQQRDTYPKLVDIRFIINNNRENATLLKQIAEATGYQIGLDPFGVSECFDIMSVQYEHNKPA